MATVQIIVDAVTDDAKSALGSLADIAGGALSTAVGGLLTDAFEGATSAISGFFSAALDAEKQQAGLAAVIKSTGGAAGLTQDAVNGLAQQFRDLAGGSDEAIVSIEEIGIRSGQINANQMPEFIKNVTDLGTVMGDTSAAATLLARAQDDPEAAFKRIERATGAYDVALAAQIKTLQKSGDTAGATALIMQFVADKTGGAAAAAADTMSGRWEILTNNLQDAGKGILEKLLPPLEQLFDQVITPALPVVERLATLLGQQLTGAINFLIASVKDIISEGGDLGSTFDGLNDQIPGLQTTFGGLENAVLAIERAFITSMPMIQQTFKDMADFVIAQVNILAPTLIANITGMLNQLAIFWQAHGTQIMAIVKVAFEFIAATIGGTLLLVTGLITTALNLINGNWAGAWKTATDTLTTFMNLALSIVGTNLDKFTAVWQGVFTLFNIIWNKFWSDFIASWQGDWSLAQTIVSTIWDNIVGKIQGAIAGIMSIINGLIGAINSIPGVSVNLPGGGGSTSTTTNNSSTTVNFNSGANDTSTNMAVVRAVVGSY